jgi:chromate reductase
MKIIGFKNSNHTDFVVYTMSLFENKESHLIDLSEFKNELTTHSNVLLQHIKEAHFLIISLTRDNDLSTIKDWCEKTANKDAFNSTAVFILSTSDTNTENTKLVSHAKLQFTTYGAEVLDTFHLPSFETNFDSKTGLTDIKLSLTFIRKVNAIKQTNFNGYFINRASTCGIDTTGFENCDASSY